jgi:plasmid stabilization system protein ParE
MIGYRLLPPAEEEMTKAALYYETARLGLGDDFLDDVQHAIDTVRSFPDAGFTAAYGFRRMLLRRFPFTIIYAIEAKDIAVVAVAHQRRSPNYWKGRV